MPKSSLRGQSAASLLYILVAALGLGLGLWWALHRAPAPAAVPPPALETIRLLPEPRPLADFALQTAGGATLDKAALQGRWTLAFLGFTHCPDICPTTLAELAQAEKALADLPEAQRPRVLFVSADPERDSPDRVVEYARWFSPQALAATAPVPALETFAKQLMLVFVKVPLDNGDYTIDHSAQVVLLDPEVRFAGFIRPPLSPKAIADDLRRLVEAR